MQKYLVSASLCICFALIFISVISAQQLYPFGPQPAQGLSAPLNSPYTAMSSSIPITNYPYGISTGMPGTSFPYGINTGMPGATFPYGINTSMLTTIVPPGYPMPQFPPGYPMPQFPYGIDTSMLSTLGIGTMLPPFIPGISFATTTALPPETSTIEKIFAGEFPTGIATNIQQFGYDAFQQTVSTFAPVLNVPVSEDYVIGPGDSFVITLWGKVNITYPAVVDRNGEISIPEIGVLKVWGLTFGEMKKYLEHEIGKNYTGFEMAITMDRIKTIQVYIVGAARVPGSYTLSSLATLFNALFAAGGPSKTGTMRNIQLIRNGKVIEIADLYEFLLNGDRAADVRLENLDTIFIPVIGKVAGIAGNVKRPAIYEMKEKLNLAELIQLAGGVTAVGYLERVQVERMEANQERIVADFNLTGFDMTTTAKHPEFQIALLDSDLVKIYPILPEKMNVVYLEGYVYRPGEYELKEGMRLHDLIPNYDVILPHPSLEYGQIIRLMPPDLHPEAIQFNLGQLLAGDTSQNLLLQRWDRIQLFSWSDRLKKSVIVSGMVHQPGEYDLSYGMRVQDLILNAGGFIKNAYLRLAEITRRVITQDGMQTKKIDVNLEEAMRGNPEQNILLQDYDNLVVRPIPELEFDRYVSISGEIKFPGIYPVKKGERLSSILERAGGYTDKAYLKGAVFTRQSAQLSQKKRLDDLIRQQEEQLLSAAALAASGTLDKDDLAAQQKSLALQQQLLTKLSSVQVEGRVVVKLAAIDELKRSKENIELEKGDDLYIPETPGIVQVLGEVYNPTSLIYEPNQTVRYYLSRVGGITKDADEGQIYIIRADGSVYSRAQKNMRQIAWDSEQRRWFAGGFYRAQLDPGDTVLVPRKLDRKEWVRDTKDISQIFYQIAVGLGVLIRVF